MTKQQHDTILWYYNDTRIALINGDASKSCLYDGEGGRFRDRLEVDYETGSLIITNVTAEHTGVYEAEIIRSESPGNSQSLNKNPKCDHTKVIKKQNKMGDTINTLVVTVSDSRLSAGAIAGIGVAVSVLLVIVAAVGVITIRRLKEDCMVFGDLTIRGDEEK